MTERPAAGPGIALVERMSRAARSMDDYLAFFAEDVRYRFANNPPVVGRQGIREAVMQLRQRIQGVSHDVKGMWEAGDVVVCEMEVTYTRQDGRAVTLPCCNIYRIKGDKVQEMGVYVDLAPVFSA